MAPIRTYSNWNSRTSSLGEIRKSLSIHSMIDISYLEKTAEHENLSSPKKLIQFADEQKKNGIIPFDKKFDKMIVVFDADIFEREQNNYEEIIELGKKQNILGVTNPSFELFLLLHYEGSVDEIILPDSKNIISNTWVGNGRNKRRYIEDIFRKKAKMNPKSNMAIGELASQVFIAINQEKKLNNNIELCKGIVTSNIGVIIQSIIDDQCNDT